MSRIIVANATPIISLCAIEHEYILQRLFSHIRIAQAVDRELRATNKAGSDFSDYDWVKVDSVSNRELVRSLQKDLDLGEAETIALALHLNADVVLIDEFAGYQIAKNLDLPVSRTLSVLKTAKQRSIVPAVRPLVEDLLQKGRWYSQALIDKFLHDLGE